MKKKAFEQKKVFLIKKKFVKNENLKKKTK